MFVLVGDGLLEFGDLVHCGVDEVAPLLTLFADGCIFFFGGCAFGNFDADLVCAFEFGFAVADDVVLGCYGSVNFMLFHTLHKLYCLIILFRCL